MYYKGEKIYHIGDFQRLYQSGSCGHFFDHDTMRFWGSRVLADSFVTDESCYFITSEKSGFENPVRKYSIRRGYIGESGKLSIETLEFNNLSRTKAISKLKSMEKLHRDNANAMNELLSGIEAKNG